jgi:hypothetical protein
MRFLGTLGPLDSPTRMAFSTLAFPDASLSSAVLRGRRWGYDGVELRLIDGELAQAGRYGGFSGPEGFHRAAQALKFLLNELAISWR